MERLKWFSQFLWNFLLHDLRVTFMQTKKLKISSLPEVHTQIVEGQPARAGPRDPDVRVG